MKISSRKDWIVIGTCLFVILATLISIIFDDLQTLENEKQSPIGKITYRYRVAQKRQSQRALWKDVEQNSEVYNNNFIRTDDLSEATIFLLNGAQIELDANSMVVLYFDPDRKENPPPVVDIKRGNVLVKNQNSGDQFKVILDQKIFPIKNTEARISFDPVSKQSKLQLNRGEMKFLDKNKNEVVVQQGETVDITPDTWNQGKLQKVHFENIISSPTENSKFFTDQKTMKVNFSWTKKISGFLIIAADYKFREMVQLLPLQNSSATSSELPSGFYFWKLRFRDASNVALESLPAKFRIISKPGIRILSPSPDEVIPCVKYSLSNEIGGCWVFFQWQKSDLAFSYEVKIFSKDKPNQIIHHASLTNNYLGFVLPSGSYSFQMTAISSLSQANSESEKISFMIEEGNFSNQIPTTEKSEKTTVPKNENQILSENKLPEKDTSHDQQIPDSPLQLNPGAGEIIDMTSRDNLPFLWQKTSQTDYYSFAILSKGKIIIQKNLSQNYFSLTDLSLLDIGNFSWQVKSCRKSQKSAICSNEKSRFFKIILTEKLTKPEIK